MIPESTPIAVLAKAPVPGYAKTRLIPLLGAEGAATLQERFIARTVATARAADIGPVSLWCTPDCRHPTFLGHAEAGGVALLPQAAGDLGERMLAVFAATAGPSRSEEHTSELQSPMRISYAVFCLK